MNGLARTAQDTVIPFYNSILKVQAYLTATRAVVLPAQITGDPSYVQLVNDFNAWREGLWDSFWSALLNAQVVSQVHQISQLFSQNEIAPVPDDIFQSECRKVFFSDKTISTVQVQAVKLASGVGEGQTYLSQLSSIVTTFTQVDKAKVAAALKLVEELNTQFQEQEQSLNADMLAADVAYATMAINVSIKIGEMAAGDEAADPITPLIEGVIKIGQDVGKALQLTGEIQDTLTALMEAVQVLNADEYQLMQIEICRSQLAKVTEDSGPALQGLARIERLWGISAGLTKEDIDIWSARGAEDLSNWAALSSLLSFELPTSQTIQPSSSGAWSITP
ncbi:hypothetical protein DI396_07885 [Litorivita pollutaquae]|uniref:Uncharacterized protein n=1 Tax=Litorivita pollutaquae TaxID=2200892 RepID=A0A2V4MZI9_9RHOB|nr:hypothetical protein [Litorivita pollutaquae]OUS22362.1 hypothetical protein A9Q95_05060 [Rhodobacterales bacterium 59_46_T64]PYC47994.1 hypothetical protein DI396_07885 [Litorivita pollutaquae]